MFLYTLSCAYTHCCYSIRWGARVYIDCYWTAIGLLLGVFQRDMAHGSTPDETDAVWKKVGVPYPMRVLFRKGQGNTVSTLNHQVRCAFIGPFVVFSGCLCHTLLSIAVGIGRQ